jgi:hypothetical protein
MFLIVDGLILLTSSKSHIVNKLIIIIVNNIFVYCSPECKVRLTVSGGWGLVTASSNLIFPATPLTHLRSFNSKNIRVNFLNSVIGWNVETLEHLELVDDTLNWMDILIPFPEETQFLDPIVVKKTIT